MECVAGLFLTFTNESLRVYMQQVLKKEHGLTLVPLDATHYLLPVADQRAAVMLSELVKNCTNSYFERVYKFTVPKEDQVATYADYV